jgi:NAD(P)H-dependent FMN reductase
MPAIVTISGTCRPDNYTSRILGVVNDELTKRGAPPTFFDATQLSLGFPGTPSTDDAKRLQEAVDAADGIVLATPEYHGTFAAMTKLVIENLGFPSKLNGKPIALVGCAAGRIGAVKSLEQLRGVCAHTGAIVMPLAVSIAGVRKVFDESGACVDSGSEAALRGVAEGLLGFIREYVQPKHCLEEAVRRGDIEPWATQA